MKTKIVALLLAAAGLAGCAQENAPASDPGAPAGEDPSVTAARAEFPRFLELDVKVFSGTCSPNPGVCHNSSNYPDLRTPGAVLSIVDAPCNLELPDLLQGWDRCERPASKITSGSQSTEIAWMKRNGPGLWSVGFRESLSALVDAAFQIELFDGSPLIDSAEYTYPAEGEDAGASLHVTGSGTEAAIAVVGGDDFLRDFVDSILASAVGGDPNQNGVWGAEEVAPAALVRAGDVEGSYLWGRITATVPGTRMPLANTPISNAEYVAIACWIEGIDGNPSAEDAIDYDACDFAKAPVDYEVH